MRNLEEYVSLVVDATINSGISRQVEGFKSGFNQVCTITHFLLMK
jgi:E3 ubiquitin-protein ligase TRIP12